jgi:hypothetical protein
MACRVEDCGKDAGFLSRYCNFVEDDIGDASFEALAREVH